MQYNTNNVSSITEQYPLSSQDESFQEATLIATLAETFGLTKFKPFHAERNNIISIRRSRYYSHPACW